MGRPGYGRGDFALFFAIRAVGNFGLLFLDELIAKEVLVDPCWVCGCARKLPEGDQQDGFQGGWPLACFLRSFLVTRPELVGYPLRWARKVTGLPGRLQ